MPTLLVADDDEDIATLISMVFTRHRWDVTTVADGSAAWEQLQTGAYDIAVLDRMMPGYGGIELTRMCRKHPHLHRQKIALVTAMSTREAIEQGAEAGADVYITKPFGNGALVAAITELHERPHAQAVPGSPPPRAGQPSDHVQRPARHPGG